MLRTFLNHFLCLYVRSFDTACRIASHIWIALPPQSNQELVDLTQNVCQVHDSDHLPTSATCMNLFKLPIYNSRAKLEDKLRYSFARLPAVLCLYCWPISGTR